MKKAKERKMRLVVRELPLVPPEIERIVAGLDKFLKSEDRQLLDAALILDMLSAEIALIREKCPEKTDLRRKVCVDCRSIILAGNDLCNFLEKYRPMTIESLYARVNAKNLHRT